MTTLSPDVVGLILKKLPIETRLALRVLPNRIVAASDELIMTVARMARVAAHPNNLCWVLARVDGHEKAVKVISYREIMTDVFTGVRTPRYQYIMPCRTMRLRAVTDTFSPVLFWRPEPLEAMFDWHVERLKQLEKLGSVC